MAFLGVSRPNLFLGVNIVLTLSKPLSILPKTGVRLLGVSIRLSSLSTDCDLNSKINFSISMMKKQKIYSSNIYFLVTGVLGENIPFKSESIDFEGVTLIFIESDLETILELGVVYWLSRVLDRTGVLGGINTISWLLEEAARELCDVGSFASWLALFFSIISRKF